MDMTPTDSVFVRIYLCFCLLPIVWHGRISGLMHDIYDWVMA